MSAWLIAAVGVAYAYVSGESFWKGNPGMGVAYLGYAIGNVGLYMLAKGAP